MPRLIMGGPGDLVMIIKNVQLASTGGTTVLSATCKIRKIGWDRVYTHGLAYSVWDRLAGRGFS